MTEPIVYLGGKMVPASQAHIAIFDAAIVMGATVTDFLRTFKHEPFKLEEHVARLYRSAKYARIEPPVDEAESIARTRELIEHNAAMVGDQHDLGVVFFMSAGEFKLYAGAAAGAGDMPATYCIHSFPLPFQFWKKNVGQGMHVVTPSRRHVPPQCLEPKIKHRSRLHWYIAQKEVSATAPDATALLCDVEGNVTETGGSNFVIVKDGAVISPSRRNILWGISLETVIELCDELGVPFIERDIQVYDVMNADEAMTPTTPYCLCPVTKINGSPIGDGQPGPIFRKLIDAWSKRVGVDIVKQVTTVSYPE